MTILKAGSLTKVYGAKAGGVLSRALNGINLEVEKGEFVGVMGPSGSGKTTLLNLLAGIDKPSGGELEINGHHVNRMSSKELALFRRRQLGFVFQDFNLLDTLTLAENVGLPLTLDGQKGRPVLERVQNLLGYFGLHEQMHKYPYEVSGGQQQRTAVARAVVHNPSLLLADEPTGNLDSASARALLDVFQKLNDERQATILMVTHDPFAASFCKRVVFIKDGQVYTQIDRVGDRQAFFQKILDTLAVLEGGSAHGMASARL
ncbi:ABC transporter ATP-binding protein [Tumebacillus flagellatus]|uniref:Bacitracin ABC transporter ATP-binding protein n=1 Tax=Tumebacillus flagellatus TaxID=1157490 RepID=A0A074M9K9_9BACL|nr:ABC transporter ATP-binding protein [Tumebacillus flagellatus]KEO82602.1 bacitracin ABC transporter ATP-binding protein [Tumebacillus flagellatus]